jgi:hypothetical protein
MRHSNNSTTQKKIPAKELLPPRTIKDYLSVTGKTIKRWEIQYGWTVLKINARLNRYVRSEVEDSLGVIFPTEQD